MSLELDQIIVPSESIQIRAKELADEIIKDCDLSKGLVVVCVLRGGVFFMTELAKHFPPTIDIKFDFIKTSSYGEKTESDGNVILVNDITENITNKNVLIVEDIIDTGYTMDFIVKLLQKRNPYSLKICTMLNKNERRKININADYVGFDIDNVFVCGMGLDPYRYLTSVYSMIEER